MIQGFAHPLAATICLADDLAHEVGFGVLPKADDHVEAMTELEKDCVRSHVAVDRSSEKTREHARESLGLGDAEMELIMDDARELAAQFSAGD